MSVGAVTIALARLEMSTLRETVEEEEEEENWGTRVEVGGLD